MRSLARRYYRRFRQLPRFAQRALLVLLVFTTVLTGGGLISLFGPFQPTAEAAWYDDNYLYRQPVTITNSTGSTQTNLQYLLTVNTASLISAGKLQSSCQDLRFTNQAGKLVPYYIDSGCNTT